MLAAAGAGWRLVGPTAFAPGESAGKPGTNDSPHAPSRSLPPPTQPQHTTPPPPSPAPAGGRAHGHRGPAGARAQPAGRRHWLALLCAQQVRPRCARARPGGFATAGGGAAPTQHTQHTQNTHKTHTKHTHTHTHTHTPRSDVVCEYPLGDMLAFHKEKGGEATILVTRVDDPSKYGVVVMDGEGKVERFVEKPQVRVCVCVCVCMCVRVRRGRSRKQCGAGCAPACAHGIELPPSPGPPADLRGRQDQRRHLRDQPLGARPHRAAAHLDREGGAQRRPAARPGCGAPHACMHACMHSEGPRWAATTEA